MGLLSWITASMVAFALGRLLRKRALRWWVELPLTTLTALAAGVAATAFDFGGWSVFDPRAIAFSLLCPAAALALLRLAVGHSRSTPRRQK